MCLITITQAVKCEILVFNLDALTETQTNFPIQIGKKFYHVETKLEVNWHQAAHNCRQLGGHLINFESSQEMDVILSIVPSARYWTSGNCLAKDRVWISIATGEAMPYLRWHAGEPNNAGGAELCIELKRTAFNDDRCAIAINYICEAKIL